MSSAASPRTRFSTPADTEIVVVREFAAPRSKVWAACTRPEHLEQWLSTPDWPMVLCVVDLTVGGGYHYRWASPTGEAFGFSGEFLAVEAPSRLVSTQVPDGPPSMPLGSETAPTVITLTLEEAGPGTRLRQHLQYPSREARDAVLASGMATGLNTTLGRLEDLLAGGAVTSD